MAVRSMHTGAITVSVEFISPKASQSKDLTIDEFEGSLASSDDEEYVGKSAGWDCVSSLAAWYVGPLALDAVRPADRLRSRLFEL